MFSPGKWWNASWMKRSGFLADESAAKVVGRDEVGRMPTQVFVARLGSRHDMQTGTSVEGLRLDHCNFCTTLLKSMDNLSLGHGKMSSSEARAGLSH